MADPKWFIFDFAFEKNYSLKEGMYIGDIYEEEEEEDEICVFKITDRELYIIPKTKRHECQKAKEPLPFGKETPLDDEDILTFKKRKYLINKRPDLEADEAKKIRGRKLLKKTFLGHRDNADKLETEIKELKREITKTETELKKHQKTINDRNNMAAEVKSIESRLYQMQEEFNAMKTRRVELIKAVKGTNLDVANRGVKTLSGKLEIMVQEINEKTEAMEHALETLEKKKAIGKKSGKKLIEVAEDEEEEEEEKEELDEEDEEEYEDDEEEEEEDED